MNELDLMYFSLISSLISVVALVKIIALLEENRKLRFENYNLKIDKLRR